MKEAEDRYYPADPNLHRRGVDETQPLSFCTPYGCSKGSADQYVLDYAHSFGLQTVVLRKSCVYGPRQFGTEDQGWLAHFLIKALHDEPIVIRNWRWSPTPRPASPWRTGGSVISYILSLTPISSWMQSAGGQ